MKIIRSKENATKQTRENERQRRRQLFLIIEINLHNFFTSQKVSFITVIKIWNDEKVEDESPSNDEFSSKSSESSDENSEHSEEGWTFQIYYL